MFKQTFFEGIAPTKIGRKKAPYIERELLSLKCFKFSKGRKVLCFVT